MVYRLYVERKSAFAAEAEALPSEMGIPSVTRARIFNRYDVEKIDRELFTAAKNTVFSEPGTDVCFSELPEEDCFVLAVEYLPGQYDQRADAAEQCIQLISKKERPTVRTARIYYLYGNLTGSDREEIERCLINPVESRRAQMEPYETLCSDYPEPEEVKILSGFNGENPEALREKFNLAMDDADVAFTQDYFRKENRDPSVTELRVLDTYWSDHCRHTTFLTHLSNVEFENADAQKTYEEYLDIRKETGDQKPVTLMDLATIGAKYLKKQGKLPNLDDSKEINACTVKIGVDIDGKQEPWLLLFKNETHNHPTEIEPFGGAATCLGGAIRDPLSGRAFVYQAMRITGSADPRPGKSPVLPGKLPQRRIALKAAAGYSSYGNQIGLATGMVDEIYHPGYQAKHMEIGALAGAVPQKNVRREEPLPGDIVLLIGGKTGRDGIGGATGSSKAHRESSLRLCGSEVQKGNAPEERKLQRLFRDPEVSLLIKRCNDFGAGGVCVAIGELSDGLKIDLDKVPKKYLGLDGTEIAISESQERMAVVVAPADAEKMIAYAKKENILAVPAAVITEEPNLVMSWRGRTIVNLSREFIDSNGAPKRTDVKVTPPGKIPERCGDFEDLAGDINICLKRGLSERFDSTVGAGTVLMPFGGKYQLTPIQAMAAKIPLPEGHTDTCSLMSYGYDPELTSASPYHGAYLAVVESLSKLVAEGAAFRNSYLTFQEYFEKPGTDPSRWGQPLAALLGALKAQTDFGIAAIGGKDSMSGSFEDMDVPPTLVSFAVAAAKTKDVISPEFKKAGSRVGLLKPVYKENGLPDAASLMGLYDRIHKMEQEGKVLSAWTLTKGGIAEGILKMCFGNGMGFTFDTDEDIFACRYGSFLIEFAEDPGEALPGDDAGILIGTTEGSGMITRKGKKYRTADMAGSMENTLSSVYPVRPKKVPAENSKVYEYHTETHAHASVHPAVPKVLIPVFPGTNCEYESARAVREAGCEAEVMVLNTMSASDVQESSDRFAGALSGSQILFIPGGFSGGDEPDGSGRFITRFKK